MKLFKNCHHILLGRLILSGPGNEALRGERNQLLQQNIFPVIQYSLRARVSMMQLRSSMVTKPESPELPLLAPLLVINRGS